MNLGWTTVCIKYILFVFNLLFVITGIILISVGVTIKAEFTNYELFLDDNFFSTSNLLIAIGAIIFFIAFFGCCGAVKQNYCMTLTFTCLLVLIFILEFSAGISGYVLRNKTYNFLTERLTESLSSYNSSSVNEVTILWDNIQSSFDCCGVNGPTDWLNESISTNDSLPISCCGRINGAVGHMECNVHTSTLYNVGCVTAFGSFIRDHALTLGAIGIIIAIIQFLGIIFSCHLARQIKKNYATM